MSTLKTAVIALAVCLAVLWTRDYLSRDSIRRACYEAERCQRVEAQAFVLWKNVAVQCYPDLRECMGDPRYPTPDSNLGRLYLQERAAYRAMAERQVD